LRQSTRHRLAALLSAGTAAVSLSLGTATVAQAAGLAAGTGAGPDTAAAAATASCLPPDGSQPPPPSSGDSVELFDVAVVSACDVWTVGDSAGAGTGGLRQPLIEHWTGGGTWTVVPSLRVEAGRQAELTSVSAISASNIWAVGNYVDGRDGTVLILHWDGTSWTRQTVGVSTVGSSLEVSALPSGEAWAVGGRTILHRDGSGWVQTPLPSDPGLAGLDLFGVTAASASSAWAVGLTRTPSLGPVILHWDGSNWTRDHLADGLYYLTGISAVSATDAWAVGASVNDDGSQAVPVTLHWDGTSWASVPSPDPATGAQPSAALGGVIAVSASSAWAVGSYTTGGDGTGDPPTASLLQHWDGHNWTQIPTLRSGTRDELSRVAAGPAGTLWTLSRSDNRPIIWEFGTVPTVIGDSQPAATDAMSSAGLRSTITTVTTAGGGCGPATNGTIVATTPPAGTFTASPVSMTFCDFPPVVTVPSVVGLNDDQAQGTLISAGLAVGTITLSGNCDFDPGTVIRQAPAAGTTVSRGTQVSLTEATPPKPHGCAQ
jgi:PASTA domain-containing protein